jgi:hypothetical protein
MNNYVKYYLTKLVLPTIYSCRSHTNKTISYNIYCKNYGGRTGKIAFKICIYMCDVTVHFEAIVRYF